MIATHEHVYDGHKVVEIAISRFNGIDVLVNNVALETMIGSDALENEITWNLMRQTILMGSFKVSIPMHPRLSILKSPVFESGVALFQEAKMW